VIRVVLDTNVLISSIVFGGNPRRILQHAIEGRITLIISADIIDEFKGVLSRDKFKYPGTMIYFVVNELMSISEVVTPDETIDVIKDDPQDNRILECASAGGANIIISGDKHLLVLKEFRGIKIMNPADFIGFLDRS